MQIPQAITGMFGKFTDLAFSQAENALNTERYYQYEEKAAENAYKRNIDFYNNYMTIDAQRRQLEEAGMSPNLMYAQGARAGQGMTQPQGGGAPNQNYTNTGILENALLAAQITKTEADAKNVEADTKLKESQTANEEYKATISMIEMQFRQNTWEDAVKKFKEETKQSETDTKIKQINWEKLDATKESEIKKAKLEVSELMANILRTKQLTEESIQKVKNMILEAQINSQKNMIKFQGSLENTLKWIGLGSGDAETISEGFTSLIIKALDIL